MIIIKPIKDINKSVNKYKAKITFKSALDTFLRYTIFLPFYIYYKLDDKYKYRDKINKKRYEYIIKNKEKYKNKVLKEIIKYIANKDMPRELARHGEEEFVYTIFLEKHFDYLANLHLKDFISFSTYRYNKKCNKKAKAYYNACYSTKQSIEYNWFMDELEKYFIKSGFKVERDIYKSWHEESEYIDLAIK